MLRGSIFTGVAMSVMAVLRPVHAQNASLTLEPNGTCVDPGQQLVVTVSMTLAPIDVCVGQFFLAYDADALDFVGMVPAPGTPFTLPFGPTVNESSGTIDYAFAPPFGSCNGATPGPADIALITFDVIGPCSAAVRFRDSDPPAKLASSVPQTIFPELVDLSYVRVDDGELSAMVCPANIMVNLEIGRPGAVASWSDPADGCGVVPPGAVCDPPSGSIFPVGTTSVGCHVDGPCGEASCMFDVEVVPPAGPPYIVHGLGREGETRPFTGYVDPRSESSNGVDWNMGIDEIELLFSEPVRALGGGPWDVTSFMVHTTGGRAPTIVEVDSSANPLVVIRFDPDTPPPLQEWTTVVAQVEDLTGDPMVAGANMGPGVGEPDRVDFAFLPGNVDGNGQVQPVDLIRFRQLYAGAVPAMGVVADYVDMNRGGTVAPTDLIRMRQLLAGTAPATRVWLVVSMNHSQP